MFELLNIVPSLMDGCKGWKFFKQLCGYYWMLFQIDALNFMRFSSFDYPYPNKYELNQPEYLASRDYVGQIDANGEKINGQFAYFTQFYVEFGVFVKESFFVFFEDTDPSDPNFPYFLRKIPDTKSADALTLIKGIKGQ